MNLTQDYVTDKLKELGNSMLKAPYKNRWSEDNPTFGYCYIVSEAIYHYGKREYDAYCYNYGEEYGTHWLLKEKASGKVVDFTADQFPFVIDTERFIRKGFLKGGIQTKRGWISKRGKQMAIHLGLISEKQNN